MLLTQKENRQWSRRCSPTHFTYLTSVKYLATDAWNCYCKKCNLECCITFFGRAFGRVVTTSNSQPSCGSFCSQLTIKIQNQIHSLRSSKPQHQPFSLSMANLVLHHCKSFHMQKTGHLQIQQTHSRGLERYV